MIPLVLFTIGYKSLWLAAVAYPLWRAGTLAGHPAEEMTRVFLMTPVAIAAWPTLRRTSEALALWLVVLGALMLAVQMVDNIHILSMLSLSQRSRLGCPWP